MRGRGPRLARAGTSCGQKSRTTPCTISGGLCTEQVADAALAICEIEHASVCCDFGARHRSVVRFAFDGDRITRELERFTSGRPRAAAGTNNDVAGAPIVHHNRARDILSRPREVVPTDLP